MILVLGCSSEKEAVKTIPQVSTTGATNITLTNASTGGNVSVDGGAPVTSRGVVWNTSTAPSISLTNKTSDGTGIGNFSSAITNLIPSTNYYARAYATNSVGTGYGNEITFTTGAVVLPTLITATISTITSNSAVSGGTITANGGATITARGLVWSTSTNPTIVNSKTTDGIGTGSFESVMTGLNPATTYYVKAYATNSAGTSYGTELSFTTATPIILLPSVVTIGAQTWTTKNLDVTTYSDGTPIPQVTDPRAWWSLTTGAWCYYNNDSANGATYGKLYNWYAVAGIHDTDPNTPNKKLAPTGYHIPSDAEWTTLTTYLGVDAGGKMKSTGTSLWSPPSNQSFTNSSGFTGLPGGYRDYLSGLFHTIGKEGHWWSSSDSSRTLYYLSSGITNDQTAGRSGFSVRCIKD